MAIAVKQKPKQTTHHRKRTGTHQRRSQHFAKTYWPYLPLGAIVAVGLLVNSMLLQPNVLSYATDMTPHGLLAQTNTQRTSNSLGAFALNATLSEAAQAKADDMVQRDYWSHTTPDGDEPWAFINQTGYQYEAAGENLAYGFTTNAQAVAGWMNSPGHRANILNASYSEVGFGIANSPNFQGKGEQTVVVAMYAKPVAVSVRESATPSRAASPTARAAANQPQDHTAAQPIAAGTTATGERSSSGDLTVTARVAGETKVARVQLATSGAAPWSLFVASVVGTLLLVIFVTRHSFAWHRALVKGEAFIIKHKVLDVVVVSGVMVVYILSRTAGVIQ